MNRGRGRPVKGKRTTAKFHFTEVFSDILDNPSDAKRNPSLIVDKEYTLFNKHVISLCKTSGSTTAKAAILGKLLRTNITTHRMTKIIKDIEKNHRLAKGDEAKESFINTVFSLPYEGNMLKISKI